MIFKSRWGVGGEESKTQFAMVLFVGMIVHGLFAEVLNRAPGLILSNVNYVNKVVFPLEILPVLAMGATLFHSLISLRGGGLGNSDSVNKVALRNRRLRKVANQRS